MLYAYEVKIICSLKAPEKVNLSIYSFFTMLGGMMLPFFAGIAFYNESMTVAKAICVAFLRLCLYRYNFI